MVGTINQAHQQPRVATPRSIADIFRYVPWTEITKPSIKYPTFSLKTASITLAFPRPFSLGRGLARSSVAPVSGPSNHEHVTTEEHQTQSTFIQRPRRYSSLPLVGFHAAERSVFTAVKKFKSVSARYSATTPPSASFRFQRLHERVHECQRKLLRALYSLYEEVQDNGWKVSKAYREQLPPEDQRELHGTFSENIFFAAQALCAGFRVRGIEHYTEDLIHPAQELCAAFDALRYRIYLRMTTSHPDSSARNNLFPPYEDLVPVLADFDRAWSSFEQQICQCYYVVTYHGCPSQSEEMDFFQVLMSETVSNALLHGLVTFAQLQSYDPSLMFTLPRLTLLNALVQSCSTSSLSSPGNNMTERGGEIFFDITKPQPGTGLRWFRRRISELSLLREKISLLSRDDIRQLERILAAGPEDQGRRSSEPARVKDIYHGICQISDELHSSVWAPELSLFMQRVFDMFL